MDINEKEFIELYGKGKTDDELGKIFGCSSRTIERHGQKYRNAGKIPYRADLEINVELERQKQKNKDLGRIDRKTIRDYLRTENTIIEYHKELVAVLKKYPLPKIKVPCKTGILKGAGIFHLTDLHLNELVNLEINKYDFTVASKRLKKFVDRAKVYFKAAKVGNILVALTGDLLNSDRRLDELLSESTNRSKATFLAVSLLEQTIIDLAKDFKITMVNVTGNESRIQEHIGWSEILATDNYDYTIYNILKFIFRKTPINFIEGNPIEQTVEVNNQNVLFLHGNQLKAKMEQAVQKIKGKYIARKTSVDFIISGHKHSARIGDTYARGSSLVGANGYSDSALQLESRASQNIHIFYGDGNRDSIKIDLQNTNGIKGYDINKELEAYNAKSANKAKKKTTVVKVVI